MGRRYENEHKVPLFGEYSDPFGDRRGSGEVHPAVAPDSAELNLHRGFADGRLYVSWLGHSSVFLHMQGQNLLMDPVFSTRTSPVPFAGPRRFPGPVPKAEDFPEIDLVLITHSHYDHLDKGTLRSLDRKVGHYLVPEGVGRILRWFGIGRNKITELSWYETVTRSGLEVTLVPSQHDSGRSPFSMNRTLWGGFVLQGGGRTVFDSGDGGYGDHFSKIHEKFGDVDLAIMECGQYNERWHAIHMFPEESVRASLDLHAKLAVPVHWGAYVLSDHAWDDPPRRFTRRAQELGQPCRILRMNEWLTVE